MSSRGRSDLPTARAQRHWRSDWGHCGGRVAAAGFPLGYHNHGHELEPLADGTVTLDVLAEVDGLELELDLGWLWVAGSDPVARLAKHAGRVPLAPREGLRRPRDSAPVGDGAVGYDRIVPVARDAGVEWLIVEQEEHAGDPLARRPGQPRLCAACCSSTGRPCSADSRIAHITSTTCAARSALAACGRSSRIAASSSRSARP